MSFQGRSLDDLPLAAYSSGFDPDEPNEADEPEPAQPPMDARAAALSIVEPRAAESPAGVAEPKAERKRVRPGLPHLPHLPRLPRRQRREPAPAQESRVTPPPQVPRFVALPRDTRVAMSPPAELAPPAESRRMALRPRMLAAGAVVVGVVVLAVAFGPWSTSGAFAPGPTASPPPVVVVVPPGAAVLTLSGAIDGAYTLTGTEGFGRPSDDRLASTWTDMRGGSLTLTGQASTGTRPTGPDIELTWTVVVDGAPVTFTSRSGECVVGMAVKPTTVSGSIVCEELTSEDGKVVVGLTGTYHT